MMGAGAEAMAQSIAPTGHSAIVRLATLACAEVLQDAGLHTEHRDIRERCVCMGVLAAIDWLANGKCFDGRAYDKDEVIAENMFGAAPYISLSPLSGAVVQELFSRGFDWLEAFDIEQRARLCHLDCILEGASGTEMHA